MDDSTTLHEDGEARAATRSGRLRTFSSLRHQNFRYLWFGTLLMSGGQWIQQVTLARLRYDLINARLATGAF